MLSLTDIARATHEVNKAYCEFLGDNSQKNWFDAPDWQKESALQGVKAVLERDAKSPEEQHESWMKHKLESGWVYGETKDEILKTHPCLVTYENLPKEQQLKDHLFRAVVETLQVYYVP